MAGSENRRSGEIELVDIFRILKKRRYLIIIPTILISIAVFLFISFNNPKNIFECKIDTDNLKLLIDIAGNKIRGFSVVEYNKYIEPVIRSIALNLKEYGLEMGENDLKINLQKRERFIYSIIIKAKSDNIKDRSIIRKSIEDFYKRFEDKIFNEFLLKKNKEKIELENKIFLLKKKIKNLDKELDLVKNYFSNKQELFVNPSKANLSYLPPYQQYVGINLSKGKLEIALELNKEKLKGINYFFRMINENGEKAPHSFDYYFKRTSFKKYERLYMELKLIAQNIGFVRTLSLNNITSKVIRKSPVKYSMASLLLFVFLMIIMAFSLEWWKENRGKL